MNVVKPVSNLLFVLEFSFSHNHVGLFSRDGEKKGRHHEAAMRETMGLNLSTANCKQLKVQLNFGRLGGLKV